MNPKSLRGLKNLTSKLVDKPKLIDKLDELRIRYAEITSELENLENLDFLELENLKILKIFKL